MKIRDLLLVTTQALFLSQYAFAGTPAASSSAQTFDAVATCGVKVGATNIDNGAIVQRCITALQAQYTGFTLLLPAGEIDAATGVIVTGGNICITGYGGAPPLQERGSTIGWTNTPVATWWKWIGGTSTTGTGVTNGVSAGGVMLQFQTPNSIAASTQYANDCVKNILFDAGNTSGTTGTGASVGLEISSIDHFQIDGVGFYEPNGAGLLLDGVVNAASNGSGDQDGEIENVECYVTNLTNSHRGNNQTGNRCIGWDVPNYGNAQFVPVLGAPTQNNNDLVYHDRFDNITCIVSQGDCIDAYGSDHNYINHLRTFSGVGAGQVNGNEFEQHGALNGNTFNTSARFNYVDDVEGAEIYNTNDQCTIVGTLTAGSPVISNASWTNCNVNYGGTLTDGTTSGNIQAGSYVASFNGDPRGCPAGTFFGTTCTVTMNQNSGVSGGPVSGDTITSIDNKNGLLQIDNLGATASTFVATDVGGTTAPETMCGFKEDWTWGSCTQGITQTTITPAIATVQAGVSGNTSGTSIVSIATPAVVSWTGHGLPVGQPFVFSTTGALPTGITAGALYYVIAAGYTANSFEFSATKNGNAVNTSGSQSGTQTVTTQTNRNAAPQNIQVNGPGTLVGSATTPAETITQTWNTSGNATGITLDITDIAAGASSQLLNLMVGNTSEFKVSTSGVVVTPAGTLVATSTASPAQGDVLYYGASGWVDLGHGTAGQHLQTNGASANPTWASNAQSLVSTYHVSITGGTTDYMPVVGWSATSEATAGPVEQWFDRGGTVGATGTNGQAFCGTTTAPGTSGGTQTLTFTLLVDGSAPVSGPVCTISGNATTATDAVDVATLAAGHNLSWQVVSSAGAATTATVFASITFTSP